MTVLNSLEEIKRAVDQNKVVFWSNISYRVIKDKNGKYFIQNTYNNNITGLTWADNETLNGEIGEFHVLGY